MLREAIRQTKSFRWTQHLPPLLHLLGKARAAAGDAPGVRRTLAELEALLASGQLEPERCMDALVAIALCRKALGDSDGAQKSLTKAVADAKRSKVSAWLTAWVEKFPLESVKSVSSAASTTPPAVASAADLQPVSIASDVLPGETARVRFTLSNPAPAAATGTFVFKGDHLAATWDAIAAEGRIRILSEGGESELRHSLTLHAGDEWLITGDAAGHDNARLDLEWQPISGPAQPVQWTITRHEPDAVDVAITNASLAGRNPFYALRLHHAFSRRRGDDRQPVGFRILASLPIRLEILDPNTGALLAADSNGDGDFTGAGDILVSDHDHDGFPDLPVSAAGLPEIAILVYPSTSAAGSQAAAKRDEITLDVQVKDTAGWESAAKDILK